MIRQERLDITLSLFYDTICAYAQKGGDRLPKTKERKVCLNPEIKHFRAINSSKGSMKVPMDVLEAIRWVDVEGLSQQDAALRLGVSRGTLQRMLYSGHKIIAEALIYGYDLVIQTSDAIALKRPCCEDCHCMYKIEREKYDESENRSEI